MANKEPPSQLRNVVMDIYPWSGGLGFEDAHHWWEYVWSQSDDAKLELLLMMALLNQTVEALLLTHDAALINTFHFSEVTQVRLSEIDASSLSTFAEALLRHNENGFNREIDNL